MYRILDNSQVLIESESGTWVHYDMRYHFRLSQANDIVIAQVYDYLDQMQSVTGVEVTFAIQDESYKIETIDGIATMKVAHESKEVTVSASSCRSEKIKLIFDN